MRMGDYTFILTERRATRGPTGGDVRPGAYITLHNTCGIQAAPRLPLIKLFTGQN